MCAAHSSDLAAAAAEGLRTAFVARPEENPGFNPNVASPADISTRSLADLADQLGA
jgi:2-haloacid dehalogenase